VAETSYIRSNDDDARFVLDQHTKIFIAHRNNSPLVDVSLHSNTSSQFWAS